MKIGTQSILFGAHQFLIHPWFVAWAWWKLYGFPWDPRLWVAFFVHDLGYFGKPNMDGPEGERHVEFGARVMHRLFDRGEVLTLRRMLYGVREFDKFAWRWECHNGARFVKRDGEFVVLEYKNPHRQWLDFCLYHSRFYAKRDHRPFSRLCVADKLAIVLTPAWLYLPMARLSGEIHEYMKLADARTKAGEPKYASMNIYSNSQRQWYANIQEYLRRWVDEHRDGREDTWTPPTARREAGNAFGVWR